MVADTRQILTHDENAAIVDAMAAAFRAGVATIKAAAAACELERAKQQLDKAVKRIPAGALARAVKAMRSESKKAK